MDTRRRDLRARGAIAIVDSARSRRLSPLITLGRNVTAPSSPSSPPESRCAARDHDDDDEGEEEGKTRAYIGPEKRRENFHF